MPSPSPPAPGETIYLDHAAATPVDPEVSQAMQRAGAAAFANPSSPHAAGRAAKRILEDARERILALVGCDTSGSARDRLVFTSGATEANRLAILGLAKGGPDPDGDAPPGWIGISPRDHPSIRRAAADLADRGWRLFDAPLAAAGSLAGDVVREALREAAADRPRILAVTTVCGQTGIRDDLAGIPVAAAAAGVLVHADATQAAGWDEISFASGPLASLTLAPHKFGGPRGIGGLVVRRGAALQPLLPGPQELGLRGGTEAVQLAAGFARALELATVDRQTAAGRVAALRDTLEAGILAAAAAAGREAIVVGANAPRAPHVAMVAVAGLDRQAAAMAADLAGICLATGPACASGSSEPATVLEPLGVPERFRVGSLRLSLGRTTTAADIHEAVTRLAAVFERLRP